MTGNSCACTCVPFSFPPALSSTIHEKSSHKERATCQELLTMRMGTTWRDMDVLSVQTNLIPSFREEAGVCCV